MLMIRFQHIGRKNDAAFRIAVLEKTAGPKAGKYVDLVGTYNPKTKAATFKSEQIKDWVQKGAQVSPSVHNLLVSKGILEGKKVQVLSKKNMEKNAAKVEEAPAAAPAVSASVAEDASIAETTSEAPVEAAVEVAPEEPAAEAA